MKGILLIVLRGFCMLLLGIILYFNIVIHFSGSFRNQQSLNKDLLKQLAFLKHEIRHNHLPYEMQRQFPEGFIFTNVLYGLTWCNLAATDNSPEIHHFAEQEAQLAYNEINSENGKSNFAYMDSLHGHGIFYEGWKNYLMANMIRSRLVKDSTLTEQFRSNCDRIAKAIQNDKSPYLMSYPGQCWPADCMVGVSSLALYDRMFEDRYHSIIQTWLLRIKIRLDTFTGLIPHATDPIKGYPTGGARGSSMSLLLIFLNDIDPSFAYKQFLLYRQHFEMNICGLPFIREYPRGMDGLGDMDSGPVIMGIGFSANIVSTGTYRLFGNPQNTDLRSAVIETFGFAASDNNTKKFIFGLLPISDVFIAWSRSIPQKITMMNSRQTGVSTPVYFHLWSFLIASPLIIFLFYRKLNILWKTRLKQHNSNE
jgi:hypothetical protein